MAVKSDSRRADSEMMLRARSTRRACVLVVTLLLLLATASPASAGTLTSTSFTAQGASAYTSAKNTEYEWAFSTATSATVSRVAMTVPTGTDGSNRYVDLRRNYSVGGYISTPDTAANSITGDIDLRAKVAAKQWIAYGYQPIIAKMDGSDGSYEFAIDNSGQLIFAMTTTGASPTYWYGNVLGTANGAQTWVRATYQQSTGIVNFYTSSDGSSWTGVGSQNKGAKAAMHDSALALRVGANAWGNSFIGKVYYAEVRNGIGGTVVSSLDPSLDAIAGTSWAASTGETWTLTRVGSNLPIDISNDLTVAYVTGLPTGGAANYRMIDGAAVYELATATAIGSSVSVTIGLLGFNNTATAGNYTSTITTFDNAGTPAAADSATTGAQAFTAAAQTLAVVAVLMPELTFTVAGRGTVCNGQSGTNFQTGSTSSAVPLGSLSSATTSGAAQNLSVVTNAGGGFSVYIRTTGTTPNALRDASSHAIADVSGTAASPGAAPTAGTAAFGYTSSDVSTAFTSNTFAKLTNANDTVMVASAGVTSKSSCVGYQLGVAATTAAGSYSAAVVYTAVPIF